MVKTILKASHYNFFLIEQKYFLADENYQPCSPTPCGANAVCREHRNVGACTCLPDFYGNPYEGCRPECIMNSDCPKNLACNQYKCRNPCLSTCGQNALCQVINHVAHCTCVSGYSGNPFNYCSLQIARKIFFHFNQPVIYLLYTLTLLLSAL